jgi:2-phosphosulfolactate phosphatase
MKIERLYGEDGAKKSKGLVIIIDIFRAANVAAYALSQGAEKILPVSTLEQAFNLKKKNPEYLLVGEVNGYKPEGFDYGNSPYELLQANIKNKSMIHRSTQGTQGLVNALNADEIIFGSFSVVSAIVKYIRKKNPSVLSIIAMDGESSEDDLFAGFLQEKIENKNPTIEPIVETLRKSPRFADMLNPEMKQFPIEDFKLCLTVDAFNFIPIARQENGLLVVRKMNI